MVSQIAQTKRTFIIFALIMALMVSMMSFVKPARADFLSCAVSGENIGDCLDQESEDQTSFTSFEGGLTAPSTEGYSPGLTQATTGREFILNVTNFILGFLGILAVVIVIYGGFLYVTAAGQEEQATKGKKSITYAIIGIILILGSFAIVNTILVAPSDNESGLAGSAPTEGVAGTAEEQQAQRRALFNLAAAEVNTIATNFTSAYQNYEQINIDIDELLRVPEVSRADDLHALIRQKLQILEKIKSLSGQFSKVNEKVQPPINALNGYLQNSQKALADAVDDHHIWEEQFWQNNVGNFQSDLDTLIGGGGLLAANKEDFALAVVESAENVDDLRGRIERNVNLLDLTDVRLAFDDLQNELNGLASGSTDDATATLTYEPGNTDLLRILKAMAKLATSVEDILFIHTVITANVTEGNAPLIVQMDGLRSLDPLNRTIQSNAYKWEFGDDGTKTSEIFGKVENNQPSVLHVYDKPGTYVVKLTIEAEGPASPNDPAVADGVGYARITVRPPVTKINLEANITGQQESFPLRLYSEDTGALLIDRGVLKVTPAEAAAGIEFDASQTDAKNIQAIRWSFGDNSQEVFREGPSSVELKETHAYEAVGNYPVILEITDIQGNVDRKLLTVVVDTPIARMQVSPGNNVFVNEQFTLDASSSASEGGQIDTYNWQFENDQSIETEGPLNFETVKARYLQPGLNNVTLEVTDTLGGADETALSIVVESKAPESQFKYEIPKDTQPSVVAFDGSLSYDPDGTGDLAYKWEVDGQESGTKFSFVEGTSSSSEKPKIQFEEKGTYTVTLTAIDPNGFGTGLEQEGDPVEQEIVIDSVLDIAWGANDKATAQLEVDEETGVAQAPVHLTLESDNAVAYEINWGDGEIESGNMTNTVALNHMYMEAGTFVAEASVFDVDDEDNTIARKIFIGSSDTPVAVATVSINGEEVFDSTDVITINRTDTITFEASKSLNTDGTGRRLTYSWDFGNGQRSTQEKTNQQYRELGSYEATLKVTNAQDVSQVSPIDTIKLEVVGEPPILRSITAAPTTTDLTTPVSVSLQAVGAEDPDGRISRYRWWYYDPSNDADQLGVQVTTAPSATITIGTRGLEGEEKTYKFAVEMTDDENNSISSRELLAEDRTATLTVTNGPNKAPTASFNVDRTSITAGESINFSSSSTDSDGQIVAYYWDFEGDGFANNTENLGSNVSHTFTKGAIDGVRVRLKVRDNNESEATSDPVTIYVDAIAQDPVAAFTSEQQEEEGTTVNFTDNSEADTAAGATLVNWQWDFDTSVDSNGDGSKDNDLDATGQNVTYEYPDYGIYRARLTVEDSEGSTSSVTNFVNVKSPTAAAIPAGQSLDARLLTNPAANAVDNRIHLKGDSGSIELDYSTSVGNITKYVIDKNALFDTNGNGILNDDEDHVAAQPGKWITDFQKEWGNIRIRLTVFGADGSKDYVEKDVVFDSEAPSGGSSLSANIFGINDVSIPAALVTALGFGILSLSRKRTRKNK